MDSHHGGSVFTPIAKKSKRLGLNRSVCKVSLNQSPHPLKTATLSSAKSVPRMHSSTNETQPSPSCATTPLQALQVTKTSLSTGQYKLSLNRRVRDKYRKKRLDFHDSGSPVADISKGNSSENSIVENVNKIDEVMSVDETNATREQTGDVCKEHETNLQNLRKSIGVWKEGFKKCVEDICAKLHCDQEELLKQLNISSDMLKYLEDK